MRRDMDLVRAILLELEEAPYDVGGVELQIEPYSREEMSYHIMLLDEAGLIEARDDSTFGGPDWVPKHLTWAGHEFLEASRDNGRWDSATRLMKEKGGGMAFDVLKSLLIHLMSNAVMGT